LLEHGKFTRADTDATTNVLLWYSLGIVGLSAQQMLARGFYARSDTKPPIYMGLAAMAMFCALGVLMMRTEQGAAGLALAASLALTVLGRGCGFRCARGSAAGMMARPRACCGKEHLQQERVMPWQLLWFM
jgi:peptidoglycan biosynthesis protein MviN/MurJ (putative lipid II flippase)